MEPKIIQIRKSILNKNDQSAQKLRLNFERKNVFVLNLVSAPGSGKTELLQLILKKLKNNGLKVGAVVGDLATDNDAKRIARSGVAVKQINTDGNCHLDAEIIKHSIKKLNWQNLDFLFIENVGNLVCPANYDLGENLRIVMMSTTEGEDKPLKYPTMFNSADICLINKIDLEKNVGFNRNVAKKNIKKISPNIKIFRLSAKKDVGVDIFCNYLMKIKAKKTQSQKRFVKL
jgi:hydrogenase nickel incorporation protein HypB